MARTHLKKLIPGLAALILLGGCSDNDIKLSRAPIQRQDTLSAQAEVPRAAVSAPDYDFSAARVAGMQYDEVNQRLDLVARQLQKTSQEAKGGERVGVEQLTDRAHDIKEELASVDARPDEWADPEMVRDVLEIQVETSDFQNRMDL